MKDWRLKGQFDFLKNTYLEKIVFPDFWEKAYLNQNSFFKMIQNDGKNFVKQYGRGEEFLVGDKVQDFWHEHCVFCTEKITTRDNRICYCTDKFSVWICKTCFDDFNKQFNWRIINN